jgi:hypothetical protein
VFQRTDQPPAALEPVPMSVQLLPAWLAYWNSAEATPEPASAESDETVTADPVTFELADGAVTEPVGAVLSTLTATGADVVWLPTLSVVMTRRSCSPSATPTVVSHVTDQPPAALMSVPMSVQLLPPWSAYWNSADATPAPASPESEETVTAEPLRFALAEGAVMDPLGAVESLVKVSVVPEEALPALSIEVTVSVGAVEAPSVQANALVDK